MTAVIHRKCGRPAAAESEKRLQHLIHTALRIFLDQGYGAASLEGIAGAAGVAKTTIYRHFGTKKSLFERCMDVATCGFRDQMAELSDRSQSVEEGLLHLARCLMEVIYKPESLKLMHLLFAESPRFPELGRIYHTHGKSIFMTQMVGFLERGVACGRLKIEDIPMAADQFHHLVMSGRFFDVLLNVAAVPSQQERERIAEQAVHIFLTGYAGSR